ncbi:MAG TPA: hypothetical protein DD662_10655, partial [Planctomycetaceae bacterium]|nr:hypothetical protein [Planctomycetaceae bacterium]
QTVLSSRYLQSKLKEGNVLMKVLVIPMCTLLGLASVSIAHNPLTPIEEYHVQEYLSELEESITPKFIKDILESVEM